MSVSSPDAMYPSRLFSLLTDPAWSHDANLVAFSDLAYEYLLRFCEVNRNGLIDRIEKECVSHPTPVLMHRICQLLLDKWNGERDYRFLNLLYKFRTKRYLENLPKDAAGSALRAQIDQTLNRELRYD
jgi:hypothetical protein